MVQADEEARAALYRQQQDAGCRHRKARERQLSGSGASRTTNYRNWEPIILARLENRIVDGREGDECQ